MIYNNITAHIIHYNMTAKINVITSVEELTEKIPWHVHYTF